MATLGVQTHQLNDRPRESSMESPKQGTAPSAPKISLSLGVKKPPTEVNGKRHRSLLEEPQFEEKEYQQSEILQFGGPTAPKKQEAAVRIIQPQPNRDWRDESKRKRQRSHLPTHTQPQSNGDPASNRDVVNGNGLSYGLIMSKSRDNPAQMTDEPAAPLPTSIPPLVVPKTDDELAMEALLGNSQPSTAVIARLSPPPTEDAVFRTDYDNAPPMATLEQYAAMPVEEFGAALLRGQGWKEGEAIGRRRYNTTQQKERIVAKRPALLGIGAKDSGMGVELGAWGKNAKIGTGKGSKRMEEVTYNPVVRRNKQTGELLTDDEFKMRLEAQKLVENRAREDSRNSSAKGEERYENAAGKLGRRDGNRDSDRDSDRRRERDYNRSSRKDRSRSADSRHRRRRYDDEEGYRERNEKEHRRYDKDRDERYDSSRSRRERRDGHSAYDLDRRR